MGDTVREESRPHEMRGSGGWVWKEPVDSVVDLPVSERL